MSYENKMKPVRCGCGGEAFVSINGFIEYHVVCASCGLRTDWFRSKDKAITAWNRAMSGSTEKSSKVERTAKALSRKLDAAVEFKEGGIIFTYDKGTSILHECESCGTFVKPGEIYCHNCGARLEWE